MKTKLSITGWGLRWVCGMFSLCVAFWVAGCDDPSDNTDFDYVPPSGHGAIIVDNLSPTDVNVFVDGSSVGRVGDDHDEHFDLTPGSHRVVLDQEDGGRSWGGDVDVLDGRLTILRVTLDTGDQHGYKVKVEFN